MEYNFREIEKRWQSQWVKDKTYHTTEDPAKEKFYVLNSYGLFYSEESRPYRGCDGGQRW